MSGQMATTPESKVTLGELERLIRKVVQEELMEFASRQRGVLEWHEESPLREDMVNISERRKTGKLKFHTHEEVWSE